MANLDLNLRRLKYFTVVAQTLNFTRAAEALHIAQSPLSQQIKRLESELGVVLIERTTREMSLTPAGKTLYKHATAILDASDVAIAATHQAALGEIGLLAAGFTEGSRAGIPRIVNAFAEAWPGVALTITTNLNTPEYIDLLHSHRVDVAIMGVMDDVRVTGLDYVELEEDELAVVVPRGHPLAENEQVDADELRDHDFIGYPATTMPLFHWALSRICRSADFSPTISQVAHGVQTHIALASAGLGITIVPSSEAPAVLAAGARMVPLGRPRVVMRWLVASSSSNTNPLIDAFKSIVAAGGVRA